ncbi:MAG TPA: HEAT repeat domain-containing protein [Thiolapillus brandeum]|uniref:HEAT repeat domain-containing protein n=1 Tax=Thiolapillus brandeum TaxID=1076588 RepID=A0A831NS77_9GAMM|nr:HEAT repeat domain-containing protein [Thiolapillus brandeum]
MNKPADALLLITPSCPHCQSALRHLSDLVKKGHIGRLEVVNISIHPEIAQEVGTRSVPWIRLGQYELSGDYSLGELKTWAEKAAAGNLSAAYIRELLEQQQLDQAITYVSKHPEQLTQLLELMQEEDGSLSVKFGIGAIFEALEGSEPLKNLVPKLGTLTQSDKANIRGDAAYYLGLSHSSDAKNWLIPLLQDPQQDVREIAAESLEAMRAKT